MRREGGFIAGLDEVGIIVSFDMDVAGLLPLLRFHLVRLVVIVIGCLCFKLGTWLRTAMFSCMFGCLPHAQMSQAHL